MSLKEKIRKELGFMKLGAKVLPKELGKRAAGYVKGQFEAAKQNAILEKQLEQEAKKAELDAYREERLKQAKLKGQRRATQRASGGGGIMAQLGAAGEKMSVSELIGFNEKTQIGENRLLEKSPLLEGLSDFGEKKPTSAVTRLDIHHYHHTKKKRR